ncbi:Na(+)/citrate cotransporter-like [Physella acuta]|uniref:Na(+)/citrate cotransporter-like n=1 Tax=Physella acuta TaxID=109671 RepID=UPI0027DB770A|nr:Na(+)/citrate cotransporter-like [Physella acuta]
MRTCLLNQLWAWRTVFILIFTPFLLLPLILIIGTKESKCGYVLILMGIYWITESLPVGVTALIPVFLFPFFEILSSNEISAQYMNDVNMLNLGGLVMAVAIEEWELHKRVALRVLMCVGTEPRWLMLGMMLATWFLSMWMSNTATAAMMIPIAEAILYQLRSAKDAYKNPESENGFVGADTKETAIDLADLNSEVHYENGENVNDKENARKQKSLETEHVRSSNDKNDGLTGFAKGITLCICYSATAGGTATLTGSGPTLTLKALTDVHYAKLGLKNPINYATWMGLGLPVAFIVLMLCWCWLQVFFLSCRRRPTNAAQAERIKLYIHNEYKKLGPLVFGQGVIVFLFGVLVALWITRDLGGVAGWGRMFQLPIKDGAAAIFVAVLLFAFPSSLPCMKTKQDTKQPIKTIDNQTDLINVEVGIIEAPEIRPLLSWQAAQEKIPWQLFFLLGGGFALSKGSEKSGLSAWIGQELEVFSSWNQWGILFMICYITAAATEVTSNTAIANLFLPIVSQLAINTGVHPLYYMLPTTLACTFAFMLPVATAPNALVFSYGRLSMRDMAQTGLMLNLLAVPCSIAVTSTIGDLLFDFANVPVEFLNSTARQA